MKNKAIQGSLSLALSLILATSPLAALADVTTADESYASGAIGNSVPQDLNDGDGETIPDTVQQSEELEQVSEPTQGSGEEDALDASPADDYSTDVEETQEGDTAALQSDETGEAEDSFNPVPVLHGVSHVQNVGWQREVSAGAGGHIVLGTSGRALRLEAFKLWLTGEGLEGSSLSYRTHVQNVGWQGWVNGGGQAGTTGRALRVESLRLKLTGKMAESGYHIYYRAHVQNVGWMGWASDGALAGTAGMSLRMEALEAVLVGPGDKAPSGGGAAWRDTGFSAQAHVQNVGWQPARTGYSYTLGTTGRALRLEALKITRPSTDASGGVYVQTHVQNVGWQGERSSGQVSGTTGRALRVEALKIRLTGDLDRAYDVWYRVHVQNIGWMGWAKENTYAGTQGMSLRCEAVQVAFVPAGRGAPSSSGQATADTFRKPPTVSGDATLDSYLATIINNRTGRGANALRRAYDYVKTFSYIRENEFPIGSRVTWDVAYAKEMYQNGRGNCYRYASLMTWLAKALGYDARTIAGGLKTGSGRSPHGWTEVYIGGTTYILDPNLERSFGRDFYLKTYSNVSATFYKQ